MYAAEGRESFAWRHDRKAKGLDAVICGKSWELLVKGCDEAKQITRNTLVILCQKLGVDVAKEHERGR